MKDKTDTHLQFWVTNKKQCSPDIPPLAQFNPASKLRYSCFPLQYFFAFLYTFIPVIPDQKTSNPHNKTRFVTDVTN